MGTDINVEFINTLDLIHQTISSSKDMDLHNSKLILIIKRLTIWKNN